MVAKPEYQETTRSIFAKLMAVYMTKYDDTSTKSYSKYMRLWLRGLTGNMKFVFICPKLGWIRLWLVRKKIIIIACTIYHRPSLWYFILSTTRRWGVECFVRENGISHNILWDEMPEPPTHKTVRCPCTCTIHLYSPTKCKNICYQWFVS